LSREGLKAEAAELNVADSASVNRCFQQIAARGRLDILVNNAGVGQTVAPVVELSDEEWQRVINITLTGAFYCCRAAGRIMERQGSGSIVNIASVNGQNPAGARRGLQRRQGRRDQPDAHVGPGASGLRRAGQRRQPRAGLHRVQ